MSSERHEPAITDVRAHVVRVGTRNQLLVKISTEEGLYGWGEAGFSGRELAVAGALDHYRELLLGQSALRRGALAQRLYRSQYIEGCAVLAGAISAVDIALHDIAGKRLGVPVYELLGGRQREYVPAFATVVAEDGPTMLEHARQLAGEGWRVIRFVPLRPEGTIGSEVYEPRETLALTAEWLLKARDELGEEIVLGLDYHHRLTVAETASFCQMLAPHTLDFLEEPIRSRSAAAYRSLRAMTGLPLAIGEEFSDKWQFAPFIEQGLTNYARLDVCCVGGLIEAQKIAAMAEAAYIDIMPHNPLGPICTAASAHLALAVANMAWLEVRQTSVEEKGWYDSAIFPRQPCLQADRLLVADQPGLGIEVDEQALQAAVCSGASEQPQWSRRDGSPTNW